MKVSEKIKFWARIGQFAFWLYIFFSVRFEMQLPMYKSTVFSGTVPEAVLAIISFCLAILFSEAIVRVIGYFAELLDK